MALVTTSLVVIALFAFRHEAESTDASPAHDEDASALVLPLDAYMFDFEQIDLLTRARKQLVQACLGTPVDVSSPTSTPVPMRPAAPNERRYGITNERQAAMFGYALGERDGESTTHHSSRPRGVSGDDFDTCTAKAAAALTLPESGSVDWYLPQTLSAESYERSRDEPEVQRALGRWRACMAEDGLHYSDPIDAAGDPRFAGDLTRHELRVAARDVRCSRQVDLVTQWATAEAAHQERLIAANQPALTRVATVNAAELQLATSLLVASVDEPVDDS